MLEFLRICGIAIPCYFAFSIALGIVVGRLLKANTAACSDAVDGVYEVPAPRSVAVYAPAYADVSGLQPAL